MKIAICFGTRPEIIKLSLLSEKLSEKIAYKHEVINIFSGQHGSLYQDVKHLINTHVSFSLTECKSMAVLYSQLLSKFSECFSELKPDLVIVHGDTATAYCAAFAAFTMNIKIGHVEAGLRTWNLKSPFPEEYNRQMIDKISDYLWCPSVASENNLIKENVGGKIFLTGNTIVDFIQHNFQKIERLSGNEIIVTLHRRENESIFIKILEQINQIASSHPQLNFIFPVHPNPIINGKTGVLNANNIQIVNPMKYEDFIGKIATCKAIISDSGGLQEEAICFNKRILICRNTTERQEAISIGIGKLVHDNIADNFEWLLSKYDDNNLNPYGDGTACDKIIRSIE